MFGDSCHTLFFRCDFFVAQTIASDNTTSRIQNENTADVNVNKLIINNAKQLATISTMNPELRGIRERSKNNVNNEKERCAIQKQMYYKCLNKCTKIS